MTQVFSPRLDLRFLYLCCIYAAGSMAGGGVADRSGLVVGALVRITQRHAAVFIAAATAICSLGHGLRIFTAGPRSTQPSRGR